MQTLKEVEASIPQLAQIHRKFYIELIKAGFTQQQALTLVKTVINV